MADPKARAKVAKVKTSLRKQPKQDRSKDLVDAVMTAAARILETTGIDSLTTNKVARAAGVSIGSLYQYFPGKDAIYSKLIEKQLDSNAAHYREFAETHRHDSSETLITFLIGDVVDLFVKRKAFISSLFAETPKLKKTREILMWRNKTVQVFIEMMKERSKDLRDPATIEEQIFVLSHASLGLLQASVLEDFETQSPETLKRQLTVMATRFLLK
jgi:AcrR family transcriptional regulator